jgi:nucleoid DNA-binding protein
MDIDFYIHQLLYEKEVVNVPGLGSFTAVKAPASFNKQQNKFSPPKKKVVFEPKVKGYDDNLAEHVAKNENITVDEASKRIRTFVKKCKEAAIDGKVVVLSKIGKLSMNEKGDYQFEQDPNETFTKSSYGMKPISAAPYSQKDTKKILEEEKKKQQAKPAQKKKAASTGSGLKVSKPVIIWSSIGAVILALAILIYFNQDTTKKILDDIGILSGDMDISVPVVAEDAFYHLPNYMIVNDTATQAAVYLVPFIDSTFVTKEFAFSDKPRYAKVPFWNLEPPVIIIDESNRQTKDQNLGNKHFHLIAGSFTIYSNAVNYKETLQERGYPNSRIVTRATQDLHRVTYNSFSTKQEALKELKRFRSGINSSAWVLYQ